MDVTQTPGAKLHRVVIKNKAEGFPFRLGFQSLRNTQASITAQMLCKSLGRGTYRLPRHWCCCS